MNRVPNDRPAHSTYLKILPKPLAEKPPLAVANHGKLVPNQHWKKSFCPVPTCRRIGCNLRSHHEFRPKNPAPLQLSRKIVARDNRYETTTTERQEWQDILNGGIDAHPILPLGALDIPLFRELFHDWVTTLFDRVTALLTPPSILSSRASQTNSTRQGLLDAAMCSPIIFYNFIAAAHYNRVLSRVGEESNSHATALIYGEIMKLLRKELQIFDPAKADQLVLVILTLVMFDVAAGKIESLSYHRRAMVLLVSCRGGVHNCGDSIPYVLSLDRMIAIFTATRPSFLKEIKLTEHKRLSCHNKLYGSFFESDPRTANLNEDVLRYCNETCRAMEILEGEKYTFDPHDHRRSSEIHYFYFLRNRLEDHFAYLNSQDWETQPLSRCILLAAKIVQYVVFMNNYITYLPIFLADQLRELVNDMMISTEGIDVWDDLILWIAFTMASMPNTPWERGHRWALDLASGRLKLKYGLGDWPESWIKTEQENLHKFVWSDTRFCATYEKACQEVLDC